MSADLDLFETPEACAMREAKEESNLDLQAVKFVAVTNDVLAAAVYPLAAFARRRVLSRPVDRRAIWDSGIMIFILALNRHCEAALYKPCHCETVFSR